MEVQADTPHKRSHEIVNHYPIRVAAFVLAFIEFIFLYWQDFSELGWLWLPLTYYCLAHPHVAFRFSFETRHEFFNVVLDGGVLFLFITMWGFNPFLTFVMLAGIILTALTTYGPRPLLFSFPLGMAFSLLYVAFSGFYFRENITAFNMLYAMIAMLGLITAIGMTYHYINRYLSKARRKLSARSTELESMNELAKRVNSTRDMDELMVSVLETLGKRFNFESVLTVVPSASKTSAQFLGAYGENITDYERLRLKHYEIPNGSDSIFLKSLMKNKYVYLPNVTPDVMRKVSKSDYELYAAKPCVSLACFPIEINGEVIAGIAFVNYDAHFELTEQDEETIFVYLMQVGIAIKNIHLYEMANLERRKAEESEKAKSRFLANMSHEIRTPMTAILGYSEALQEDNITNEERKEFTHTIIQGGRHLLSIINDILDISKIEADKIEVEMLDVNLPLLIRELDANIKLKAEEKGLNYSLDVQYPIPFDIHIDPTRIKQVLFNLASNAIKFTEKGSITVKVRWEKSGELVLSIKDTGIGLTEQEQGKLFKAFSQADTSTTRVYGGTGLGLYISKNLVQLMGGDISVESIKGEGSEFIVRLEMLHDVTDAWINSQQELDKCLSVLQGAEVVEHVPNLKGSVLVAEDTPENQKLIRNLIEKTGLDVHVVDNGKLAVEAVAESSFDLIMLDMQMPVMGGLEAAEQIQARGVSTPRIAFTANVMKHQLDEYKNKQFDDVVEKPIVREKLYSLLELYFAPKVKLNSVLIVDDNSVNRMVLARYLMKIMPTVHTDQAENGEKALSLVKSSHYDLIFMDMEMPVMGGLEATERIRELGFDMPIYMASGNVDKRYVDQGREAGANGHITKPIDRKQLEKELQQYM